MKRRVLITFTLFAMMLAGSGTRLLAADELRPLEVDDYFALKNVGSPSVSPDGKWVAYTVRIQDLGKDSRETRVWMVPMSGGEPLPMTAEGSSAWGPAWSPDGIHLSFIANSNDGDSSQVFTLDLRGGEPVQMTNVDGGVEGYEWSPDGKRLALIIRDRDPDTGPGPWVIDRLKFKDDYVGYLNRLRSHLYVFDIDEKSVTQITSGDYEDYSPTWSLDRKAYNPHFSPDGSRIYVLLEDDGQVHLAAVSVADGKLSRPIAGRVSVGATAVGPDGSVVAVVSEPRLPGELFVLDAESFALSTERRRLTHVNDKLLNSIYLADATELRFDTLDGTEIQTFVYKPRGFNPRKKYPTILWLH